MNKAEFKDLIVECLFESMEEIKEIDAECPRCKCTKAITTERHGCKCLKCNHRWNPFNGETDQISESDSTSITHPSHEKIDAIKLEFPPRITKMLDFSYIKTSESDIINFYKENMQNIIRSNVSVIDDENNAVLMVQLRTGDSLKLKVLAYGPVDTIDSILLKAKNAGKPPVAPSIPQPYDPVKAQYGGDPSERPWGLGT